MTTIGSLFTGYGGLDMGVAMALDPEARVAWTSDVEPGPCRLAEVRWPDTPNLGDITKVDWSDVEPVDIICGGSPCQDLSLAGKRAGMATGTLWPLGIHGRRNRNHQTPPRRVGKRVRSTQCKSL